MREQSARRGRVFRNLAGLSALGAILTAAVCATPCEADLSFHDTGRWTPKTNWSGTAVHMALLPGYGSDHHSRILWWYGLGEEYAQYDYYGGLWLWNPSNFDGSEWPSSDFDSTLLAKPTGAKIFCAGLTQTSDGKLFVAGGTQPGTENGMKHAWLFDPIAQTWSQTDSMEYRRWYPTATMLADGRVLMTSGSQDIEVAFFGGLRGSETTPSDTSVLRFSDWGNGGWKAPAPVSVTNSVHGPVARVGHAMEWSDGTTAAHLFGGEDASGTYLADFWLLRFKSNESGADYDYNWERYILHGDPPSVLLRGRAEHAIGVTSGSTETFLYGGVTKDDENHDVVLGDVWRFWRVGPEDSLKFYSKLVTVSAPEGSPGPRAGHAAFFHNASRQLFIFGGRNTPSGAATNDTLWSLKFSADGSSATWKRFSTTGPAPRYGHVMTFDEHQEPAKGADTTISAFMFGGRGSDSGLLNDLWQLKISLDGLRATWVEVTGLAGTKPSPRIGASMVQFGNGRVYIYGGSGYSTATDDTVYAAQLLSTIPGVDGGPPQGRAWIPQAQRADSPRRGVVAVKGVEPFTRISEIYDPAKPDTMHWQTLVGAPRLQEWYPQTFSVGRDSVFVAGPDNQSYYFHADTTSASWSPFPSTLTTFRGGDAVMYRPGKIMKAGSRASDAGKGKPSRGISAVIDLKASSPTWYATADTMIGRVNHNLVLLPTGEVLVVGGCGAIGDDLNLDPVYEPQIWNPNVNGGLGRWYGKDTLASSTAIRGYHSTALLLPDGRVLCAGGNEDDDNQTHPDIFSPPYLYDGNSLATRPTIACAPDRVRLGKSFSICTAAGDVISSVCLIRPAAVTHGFDQSQRYIPLTITYTPPNHDYVQVTAPADSFTAPPGDYMLFVVNNHGVPGVARWIRVGSKLDGVLDNVRPARVDSFHTEIVESHAIGLTWVPTGDDSLTGTAAECDVRYATFRITPSTFQYANYVSTPPTPACPQTCQTYMVTGLSSCTKYYFAMKLRDESGNFSAMSPLDSATTLCGGGGGGEEGARGVVARAEAASGTPRHADIESGGGDVTSGVLVAEFAPRADGATWTLTRTTTGEVSGLAPEDTSGVLIQDASGAGGWRSRVTVGDGTLGFTGLRLPGRLVFLKPSDLVAISTHPGGLELQSATDDQIGGAPLDSVLATTIASNVALGHTVALTYAGEQGATAAGDWFFAASSGPSALELRDRHALAPAAPAPKLEFALMPSRPNPFSHSAEIAFTLPQPSPVRLQIFDTQGRVVRTLANGSFDAGQHAISWDRTTDAGALAPSGVYWYRIEAGRNHARRKMVVL